MTRSGYYTNVSDICDEHDVPLSTFMEDVNSGNLTGILMILPANDHSMHSNSIASGDAYAQTILDPLLNSQAYANGDVAIFFLWDEDSPIPNVLLAPSIVPGLKSTCSGWNPVFSLLGAANLEDVNLPLLGDMEPRAQFITVLWEVLIPICPCVNSNEIILVIPEIPWFGCHMPFNATDKKQSINKYV